MCVVATRPHSQEDLKRHRIVSISSVECGRSEEHTSELQSQSNLVCRLLLEKKKKEVIASPMVYSAERAVDVLYHLALAVQLVVDLQLLVERAPQRFYAKQQRDSPLAYAELL